MSFSVGSITSEQLGGNVAAIAPVQILVVIVRKIITVVVEAVVGAGGEANTLGVGVIWQMRRFPQSDSMEWVGVVSYGSRSAWPQHPCHYLVEPQDASWRHPVGNARPPQGCSSGRHEGHRGDDSSAPHPLGSSGGPSTGRSCG